MDLELGGGRAAVGSDGQCGDVWVVAIIDLPGVRINPLVDEKADPCILCWNKGEVEAAVMQVV